MSIVIRLLCFLALLAKGYSQTTNKQWWERASFYQIYPRSFQDTDGDGIGDLKGIIEKLPYLKEIGITATWLSPIFTSPMADFGYDVANFYEIDPLFGTMDDFDELLVVANKLGIKIILDFVPNHSSDECEWFLKSAANDSEYKDFYVWHPGKIVNGERKEPSNWISVFGGPMWTWNEQRQAYYLHQFHRKQPDLNYRNEKVREAMYDVLRFWLRKGVSGFRIDAVPHLFEVIPDADGNYPDEPIQPGSNDPESYGYHDHIYTKSQPETVEMIYEFRRVVDEIKNELSSEELILMVEAYESNDILMKYFGRDTTEGAQIPFNFGMLSNLNINSDAYEYQSIIMDWLDNVPEGRTSNWVMGNHDTIRVGTRLGENRIDMINILMSTLPGCVVTYMGEEIGMTSPKISWEDTIDPQACQSNELEYESLTRDPARTPFQWNEELYAGFSKTRPWLPLAENYKTINVKVQRGIPRSSLNIFKQLMNLRREKTLTEGDTQIETPNKNVLIVKRSLNGYPTFITLLNLNDNLETLDLKTIFPELSTDVEYVLVTDRTSKRLRDSTSSSVIRLLPKEAAVLKTKSL